jgi:hypothetical protein
MSQSIQCWALSGWVILGSSPTCSPTGNCFSFLRNMLPPCSEMKYLYIGWGVSTVYTKLPSPIGLIKEPSLQLFYITKLILNLNILSIAVATRPKARTVFTRSNTEIMGSNPTGGMDVCVCSVYVYSESTLCGGGWEYLHCNPCESLRGDMKGNPVVSGETVPADLRKG